jgi:hypothetical protein
VSTDTALVTGQNIVAPGGTDMYALTAPTGSADTMTVTVQSTGLSLLSPKLYVYNASQQQIGFISGAGQFGSTLTVTINNVVDGEKFYVKVQGSESTALGTGQFALVVNIGSGAAPTVPIANSQVAAGSTHQSYSGQAEGGYTGLLAPLQGLLGNLNPLLGPLGGILGGLLGFVGDIADSPDVDSFYAHGDPTPAAAAAAPPTGTFVLTAQADSLGADLARLLPSPATLGPTGNPFNPAPTPVSSGAKGTASAVPAATGSDSRSQVWLSGGDSANDVCFADAVWDTTSAVDGIDLGGW